MNMIYFEHPLFVLFPIILLSLQFLTFLLNRKRKLSYWGHTLLAGFVVALHAISITVFLLNDGTVADVLVLVLLSGVLALFLSPTPNKSEEE